jgi:gamma-glutamyltranspeptidase / glutathione hydrolase
LTLNLGFPRVNFRAIIFIKILHKKLGPRFMKRRTLVLLVVTAFLTVSCQTFGETASQAAKAFFAKGTTSREETSKSFMVATAHPHATQAGFDIIKQGGSAVDASVAVQMVLTLVEPESSGIGGGAFMLTYDPKTGKVEALDGRETAPASATLTLNLSDEGEPLKYFDKVLGGKSIGIPGVLAMLEMAHNEHGNLPWADLFAYAINLAENGFEVSPKLNQWLVRLPTVQKMPDMKAYFTKDGVPHTVGTLVKNPEYARTLRQLAEGGADAFYTGEIPASIIKAAAQAPFRQAVITQNDFDNYKAKKRDVVCAPYRTYKICSMPPPSSGVTVLQIMQTLEAWNLSALEPNSLEAVHLIAEASRLAFADRGRYIGDPDFADVPVAGMLDPAYIAKRRQLIHLDHAMTIAEPGVPPGGEQASLQANDAALEMPSTSHYSIVDPSGFAVSSITTIEGPFGSHVMASGFLLNNELTDFSSVPQVDGRLVANRVEPGKRPRSSMTPTFVFDEDGKLFVVTGSSGGTTIVGAVVKTLIGVLDWNMTMQEAVDSPNIIDRNDRTQIEPALQHLQAGLEALGHEVRVANVRSGVNAIRITDKGLDGGSDKRRIGTSAGE